MEQLAQRWAESGESPASPLWRDAHTLCGHMIEGWPMRTGYHRQCGKPSGAARLRAALVKLRDSQRIDRFLTDVSAAGGYGGEENEAIDRSWNSGSALRRFAAVGVLPTANSPVEKDTRPNASARPRTSLAPRVLESKCLLRNEERTIICAVLLPRQGSELTGSRRTPWSIGFATALDFADRKAWAS